MYKIGVIARPDKSCCENEIWQIHNDVRKVILTYNGVPVVLIPTNIDYQEKMSEHEFNILKGSLEVCDGFIFQGGDDYYNFDFRIIDYAYQNDVPTLGICLGMQAMSVLFDGKIETETEMDLEHYQREKDYVHLVNIVPDTKLYEILKTSPIKVNSRHHQYITTTDLTVSAIATDYVIEAVERSEKDFFIGVQWHPESMIEYDIVSKNLFTEYFNAVRRYHENRTIKGHCRGDVDS